MSLGEFLEGRDYNTDNPYVREIINDEIRREINHSLTPGENEDKGKKKGKSAQEQIMLNLKNSENQFKFLGLEEEGEEEVDYEQDLKRREREMELVEPERFKVIGWVGERQNRRPVLRQSDMYLAYSLKMRKLLKRVFDRHINGKQEKKTEGNMVISSVASNAHALERIVQSYENIEADYSLENQRTGDLEEQQLQEYVIDRNHSKEDYFLFCRDQGRPSVEYDLKNNPLLAHNAIDDIKRQARQLKALNSQPQVHQTPQLSETQEQAQSNGEKKEGKKEERKPREYFGQFKKAGGKAGLNAKLQDVFQKKTKGTKDLADQILGQMAYVDRDLTKQDYHLPLDQQDRLELNLANPSFFQPKIHTILHRSRELLVENEYRQKIAEANKTNRLKSLVSDENPNRSYMRSALDSERGQGIRPEEEEYMTLEKVIETEIKNVYREPLRHSQLANKFEFIKFTLEEECFSQYHRFSYGFHEQLREGRVIVEAAVHKPRKIKPKGLVINAEMKESNEKFSRREDISLTKGEFILIEYIEETPLLMSDVGMCERMFLQVNNQEMMAKVKQDFILNSGLDDDENEKDNPGSKSLTVFERQAEIWRQGVRDAFGENGKQMFWDPRHHDGKLIGQPEGIGVALMQSNICSYPIVRKKVPKNPRDFLLVRQGKRWVLRRIDHMYTAGQVEPHKRVFCPGSRQHSEFKVEYEKAYIIKQIKQYGNVNFDQLKLTFHGQTDNSLRRALRSCNTSSRDGKNYKLTASDMMSAFEIKLASEDVCLYERMQKSLCQLSEVGITDIRSNEKMKNVLKKFNESHYVNPEKITIARMIREQLQLTSWYLTDSFLKYKHRTSKIEINGFADPTNGRGGYSFINKPQKERTAREDMEERAQKPRVPAMSDLRKLKVEASKDLLREMGHNENEIENKGRWSLITMLKSKADTEYSRRERETKSKKMENEKKEVNKNFNRLLIYLDDRTEEPAFDYARQKKNKLQHYLLREKDYYEKIRRRFTKKSGTESARVSEDSEDDD